MTQNKIASQNVIQTTRQDKDEEPIILPAEEKEEALLETENRETRRWLIKLVAWISGVWLGFTACTLLLQGFGGISVCIVEADFSLSDAVMVAFLTQSLGTVLGLWIVGLRYYFAARR